MSSNFGLADEAPPCLPQILPGPRPLMVELTKGMPRVERWQFLWWVCENAGMQLVG